MPPLRNSIFLQSFHSHTVSSRYPKIFVRAQVSWQVNASCSQDTYPALVASAHSQNPEAPAWMVAVQDLSSSSSLSASGSQFAVCRHEVHPAEAVRVGRERRRRRRESVAVLMVASASVATPGFPNFFSYTHPPHLDLLN